MINELRVLYEDNHSIAVYKPAGLLVQGDITGEPSLLDYVRKYLKEKYKKPGNVFLGIVHRLDKSVSGIVLFGKTSKGAARLSAQFRGREVKKIYYAIVRGETPKSGELIHYLRKDEDRRVAVVSDLPKEKYDKSELGYKMLKTNKKFSLLRVELKTGRFHQIRAQLSAIGHPIAGDVKYGYPSVLSDRSIALSATELTFKTAITGETKTIKIDLPKEWESLFGIKLDT